MNAAVDRPGPVLKAGIFGTLVALVIAEVVAAFETTMAVQLLYAPGEFFTKDLTALAWIVTAYALVAALATGFVGRLGDQFGRRNVLIAVLLLSLAGSVVSAVAPTLGVLVAGRALQGVSGAVLPLCIGIVRAAFPASKVALGVAVVSTSALVAGAGGGLVGGILLDNASWHWIFWSAAILAALASVLVLVMIHPDPRSTLASSTRIDWLGGLLFGGGIAAALYGATRSKEAGWSSPSVLGFVALGIVAVVLWYLWERRVATPMIDVRMFQDKKFSLGMFATALIALGPIGMSTVLTFTLYRTPNTIAGPDGDIALPVGLGLSATMAGVLGFLTSGVAFGLAPIIGRVSERFGARGGLMTGAGLTIVGQLVIVSAPTSMPVVVTGFVISVLGTGFLYSGMPTVIVECVPAELTSTATGMNAVVRTTFQAVASSLVAILLTTAPVLVGDSSFVSRTGLTLVVGVCVATCVLTVLVVSRIPRGPASPPRVADPNRSVTEETR
ncbi:MFS transporter [Microbacterium resistens]|uniref:MFS transporter n=1 Tax=Microbacterium resistens TaxID=156977 RepID=UPI00366DC251